MIKKFKKRLIVLVTAIAVTVAMTGCSEDLNVKINDNLSGSCVTSIVMGEGVWELTGFHSMEKQLIESGQQSGQKITITPVTENGAPAKKLEIAFDFDSIDDYNVKSGGMSTLTVNKNYALLATTETFSGSDDTDIKDSLDSLIGDPGDDSMIDKDETAKLITEELKTMKVNISFTFPNKVIESNGKIQSDGKTVVWSADASKPDSENANDDTMYALFSKNTSEVKPTFTSIKDGGLYNTGVDFLVNSENLIKTVTLKTKGSSDLQTTKSNHLFISKTGSYSVTAEDMAGNLSEISFSIDGKKPVVTGVKNGKTYKTTRTIKFSDKNSGIKKATLNGKKISNNKKISKKGSYILKVTDKAGNVRIVKFKKL